MTLALSALYIAEPASASRSLALLDRAQDWMPRSRAWCATVIGAVARTRGDAALVDYTAPLRPLDPASPAALKFSAGTGSRRAAAKSIPAEQRTALEQAAARVRAYHDRQKIDSWSYTEADGTLLGQQVTALDRVGLYVPVARRLSVVAC